MGLWREKGLEQVPGEAEHDYEQQTKADEAEKTKKRDVVGRHPARRAGQDWGQQRIRGADGGEARTVRRP